MPKKSQSQTLARTVVTRTNQGKPPYHATKNPEVMKNLPKHLDQVKAGYRMIPIGKGTWAFRPPITT